LRRGETRSSATEATVRYLGGKSRIAKKLAARIREIVPDAPEYWDPFCGGLSMSVALSAYAPVLASDACAPLIALYRAVRNGWEPPSEVSREMYAAARALPDSDPLKAFCGFACSFSGKWFGGFASSGSRNYAKNAHRSLRDVTKPAEIVCVSWFDIEPESTGAVLYLDPPYAGTTGYAGVQPFDSVAFIACVREWSAFAHIFVSEYSFPLGEVVWFGEQTTTVARDKSAYSKATERLYYIAKGSLAPLP
jgi:DNA adenine methylase